MLPYPCVIVDNVLIKYTPPTHTKQSGHDFGGGEGESDQALEPQCRKIQDIIGESDQCNRRAHADPQASTRRNGQEAKGGHD